MDTSKIEVVLRGLELGSLTKAAREYRYSPSAVSQMLESLEKDIGTNIIKRTYAGVEVADGCENIVQLLEQMLQITAQIRQAATARNTGKPTVTVAAYDSISTQLLPGAIQKFRKQHPYANIHVLVTDTIGMCYAKGMADLFFGARIQSDGLVWKPLLQDPYVAVLPTAYPCRSDTISRNELLKSHFILPKDYRISGYTQEYISENSYSSTANDDGYIIALVQAGIGVTILPQLAVRSAKGLQIKQLAPAISRELGIMYKETEYKRSRPLRDFVEILAEHTVRVTDGANCIAPEDPQHR